jgi:hypothetical protein
MGVNRKSGNSAAVGEGPATWKDACGEQREKRFLGVLTNEGVIPIHEAQELNGPKRIAIEIDQDVLAGLVECIPALVAIMTASGPKNKVAMLTGSARIGQVVAHSLALHGCNLAMTYRGSRNAAEASAQH